jgi:hypothetical protein
MRQQQEPMRQQQELGQQLELVPVLQLLVLSCRKQPEQQRQR